MRASFLVVLVAAALGVAACGGDEEGSVFTDTGFEPFGTVETELPPPPEATPEPTLQIKVPKQSIGPQSSVERVAEVQRALIALGYKIGQSDGIYGERTRKAVVRFQRQHDLEADGLVGPKTAKAINRELAKLPAETTETTG